MVFDLTSFPEETDMNHCEYRSLMNMSFQNKLTKRRLEKYFTEVISHCNNDLIENYEWYIPTTVQFWMPQYKLTYYA